MGGSYVRLERARRVACVVGELGEIGPGTEAARQHLADSILSLVGAAAGTILFDATYRPHEAGSKKETLAGFDESTLRILGPPASEGCSSVPSQAETMRRLALRPSRERLTARHEDLLPKRYWWASPWVNEHVRPARLDHLLSTVLPLGDGAVEAAGFLRAASDPPFTAEDRGVLHILFEAAGRLFRPDAPARPTEPRAPLAPRVEQTRRELLTGAPDKEIAARLGLSVHTVRQYVKTVLRAHGVQSRAQLLAQAHVDRSGTAHPSFE